MTDRVRNKAIEIANALLKEGHEDDFAIPVAISKAEEWAKKRGIPIFKKVRTAKTKSSEIFE